MFLKSKSPLRKWNVNKESKRYFQYYNWQDSHPEDIKNSIKSIIEKRPPERKMAKEDIQVSKTFERCSTSLVIQKIEVIQYYSVTTTMAKIKRKDMPNVGEDKV